MESLGAAQHLLQQHQTSLQSRQVRRTVAKDEARTRLGSKEVSAERVHPDVASQKRFSDAVKVHGTAGFGCDVHSVA